MTATPTNRRAVDLRLDRAGQHLVEMEKLITQYVVSNPYTVSHRIEGKNESHVYRLEFTGVPDETIAVIAGDFFHNVRSALNYLMAGLVPGARKRKTQFPIFNDDPFVRDPATRRYIDRKPNQRRTWNTYVKGIDPDALEYIKTLQPYERSRGANKVYMLSALNRLSNADKHYQLAVIPQGLEYPEIRVDGIFGAPVGPSFINDGAEIYRSDSEVHVDIEGTTAVLLRVGQTTDITVASLHDMLIWVEAFIVNILSPYLRR